MSIKQKLKLLTFAHPKVGLSEIHKNIEKDFIYIYFDKKDKGLNKRSIYCDKWGDFVQALESLEKSGFRNFHLIVIDTINHLADLCLKYVCNKHEMQYPSDLEYGKGWHLVSQEFQLILTKLFDFDIPIIYLAYGEDRSKKTRTLELTQTVPAMSKGVLTALNEHIHGAVHIGFNPDEATDLMCFSKPDEYLLFVGGPKIISKLNKKSKEDYIKFLNEEKLEVIKNG